MDAPFVITLSFLSFGAGIFGAMLGMGGGIFLVPLLTVGLHLPIQTAIATSLISVIATSAAATTTYVSTGLSNVRLAMVLELTTAIGAIVGSLVAAYADQRQLSLIFGVVALCTAFSMWPSRSKQQQQSPASTAQPERWSIAGHYHDPATGQRVHYTAARVPWGLAASFLAGNLSGLLGIGGGPIKVPVMNVLMRIPLKAAVATSTLMVGITATASALIYYLKGYIDPTIAAIAAISVFGGASLGARIAPYTKTRILAMAFVGLLLFLGVQMLLHAVSAP